MNITNQALSAQSAGNVVKEEPFATREASLSGKSLRAAKGSSTSGLKSSAKTEAPPLDKRKHTRYKGRDLIIKAFEANAPKPMTAKNIADWIKCNEPEKAGELTCVNSWVSLQLFRHSDDFTKAPTKHHWSLVPKEHRFSTKEKLIVEILKNAPEPDKCMSFSDIDKQFKVKKAQFSRPLTSIGLHQILLKNPQFEEVATDIESKEAVKNTYWRLVEPEKNQPSTTVPSISHPSASGWKTPRGFTIYAPVHDTNSNLTIRINETQYYVKEVCDIPVYLCPDIKGLAWQNLGGYKVSDLITIHNFVNESEDMQGIYLNDKPHYLIREDELNDDHYQTCYEDIAGKATSARLD